MRSLLSRLLLAAVFLSPAASQAVTILGDPIALSALLEDPEASIVAGDKRFSDFSYAFTGDMPEAAGVNVIPIQDDDGNFGIRFQGAFADLVSTVGGSDALIGYSVSVTDDLMSIVDAHLAGNPTLLGDFGSISVVETFDVDPELRLVIFADETSGTDSADSVEFEAVPSLRVTKDILAFAATGEGEGTVTLSFVDQTFSQRPNEIPEPVSLLLLGGGLAGLAVAGRRR